MHPGLRTRSRFPSLTTISFLVESVKSFHLLSGLGTYGRNIYIYMQPNIGMCGNPEFSILLRCDGSLGHMSDIFNIWCIGMLA